MGLTGMAFLFVSVIFLILTLRNMTGGVVKNGIAMGWIAMAGFGLQSLFLLWLTRKLRASPGSAEASVSAMKMMVGHLIGLLLASYGIGVQRRRRRAVPAAAAPPPDLS
jgi:hypothetical protein